MDRPAGRDAAWGGVALVVLLAAVTATVLLLPPPMERLLPDMTIWHEAVQLWMKGGNPYTSEFGLFGWPYVYPPFTLIVFAPLGIAMPPALYVALVNTALLGVTVWAVLHSTGPMRGPRLALGAAVVLLAQFLQPVTSTNYFGQAGILLMAMVMADLLLVPARGRGVLTGVASMIKLTPLIFVLYFLWTRQRRALVTFFVTCGVTLLVCLLVMPDLTAYFFTRVIVPRDAPGRASGIYPSLNGLMVVRFGRAEVLGLPVSTLAWLAACIVVLALLFLALRGLSRTTDMALGATYVGLTGVLISPLSWSHHWVWIVPLALCSALYLKRFPLLAAPTAVLVAIMLDPFPLAGRFGIPSEHFALLHWREPKYVVLGLLVLVAGAWYGLRAGNSTTGSPLQGSGDAQPATRSV